MIKNNNNIRDEVRKDETKMRDMLNKFNDNMKNNMSNLSKEVKLSARLDKMNNNTENLNNCISKK